MKVVEILVLAQKSLELLQKACIKLNDVRYIPMYCDYLRLLSSKKSYVVKLLSEKYGISERKVYYLIRKFSQDCNFLAAE